MQYSHWYNVLQSKLLHFKHSICTFYILKRILCAIHFSIPRLFSTKMYTITKPWPIKDKLNRLQICRFSNIHLNIIILLTNQVSICCLTLQKSKRAGLKNCNVSKYFANIVSQQNQIKGAFTQSVLRGVIRHRLGYLINKKYFFHLKNDHFTRRILP